MRCPQYPGVGRQRSQRGFTLIEMMMVVAILAVCAAVTIAVNPQMIRTAKIDGGLVQVMDTLRAARDMAISQRRNIQVQFSGTNTINVYRVNVPNNDLTLLRTVRLENRLRFMLVSGVPDTPDAFGRTSPTSFSSTVRMFTSDGTFAGATGDPMNGTLFLAVPDEENSSRAITFFGPTALLRAWRWDGNKWVE
jgi:prepilin-type N-terminal cleavage/methylation domain-containing protein